MTNAHFGQSACLGLWLLSTSHGILGWLGVVPNLAATVNFNGKPLHISLASRLEITYPGKRNTSILMQNDAQINLTL